MKVIMGTRQSGGHLTSQVGSDIWDFIGERDSTQSLYSFKILEVSLLSNCQPHNICLFCFVL